MTNAALEIGIVCGRCDTYAPIGSAFCPSCGNDLRLFNEGTSRTTEALPRRAAAEPAASERRADVRDDEITMAYLDRDPLPSYKEPRSQRNEIDRVSVDDALALGAPAGLTEEELMDQARNYVCESCMTPVPSGHKFCGRCGTPVPDYILNLQTTFFSDMQDPEKARIVLIRGEGMEGLSYHLQADQHMVGRGGALDC